MYVFGVAQSCLLDLFAACAFHGNAGLDSGEEAPKVQRQTSAGLHKWSMVLDGISTLYDAQLSKAMVMGRGVTYDRALPERRRFAPNCGQSDATLDRVAVAFLEGTTARWCS